MSTTRVYIFIVACFAATISKAASEQRTIVFDLGDTLIITANATAFRQTGLIAWARYFINNPTLLAKASAVSYLIEKRLFEVLAIIEPRNPDEACTHSAKGLLLPQIMCSWLKGERSNADTLQLVERALQAHPEYCTNAAEQSLIIAMARMMFTPEIFAQTRKLAPGAVELVQQCKDYGHRVTVLSNWDSESFDRVKQKFPELFDLVDSIVISGKRAPSDNITGTGILKPHYGTYHALLAQQTPPVPAGAHIFIDDRPENAAAAQEVGMQTILCPLIKNIPDLRYVQRALFDRPAVEAQVA